MKIYGAIAALLLVLGLTWSSWHLYESREDLQTKYDQQAVALRDSAKANEQCTSSIAALEKTAESNAVKYAADVASAAARANARTVTAQKILRTPPSTPVNDCKSASDRARSWLKGRAK